MLERHKDHLSVVALNDLADLFGAQIFRANIGIDIDLLEDALRGARADAIDIRERRFDAFVAEHHIEQPFHKRERDRPDPEALARRGPMQKTRE